MSFRQTLSSRFSTEWINNPRTRRHHLLMTRAMDAIEALEAKRLELAEPGTLTPKGLRDAVRQFAAKTTVPALRSVQHEIDKAERALAAERQKLSIPKPDPNDVAGAMIRAEWRAHLRAMKPGEVGKMLMQDNPDPRALEAVFEVPAALVGLPQDLRDSIEERYIEATHGPAVTALNDEKEAMKIAAIAVDHGVTVLQRDGEFDSNPDFDKWMQAATAAVEGETQNGRSAAPLDVEWLAEHIAGMPMEDRHRMIDHAIEQNWSDVDKMGQGAPARDLV